MRSMSATEYQIRSNGKAWLIKQNPLILTDPG